MLIISQIPSDDLEEILASPFMEHIKRREKRKENDWMHKPEIIEPCPRDIKGRRCGHSHDRVKSNRSTTNEDKENFVVPETPRTPRNRRPPTYGMSSSPPSSHKHVTKTPMSAVLSTSIDKPCKSSKYLFLVLKIKAITWDTFNFL